MPPSQDLPPHLRPEQSSGTLQQISTAPLASAGTQYDSATDDSTEHGQVDPKTGKRWLFGKRKTVEEGVESSKHTVGMAPSDSAPMMPQTQAAIQAMRPASPLRQPLGDLKPTSTQPIPISPSKHTYPSNIAAAASPSRLRSSSPRLQSPASSEIFERNVQEPVPISTLQNELTPAHIPNHVMTEDHIPAALEASVEAITNETLNADDVEIVTSTAHQPAAASVLESSASHADLSALNSPALQQAFPDVSEPASLTGGSGFLQNPADEEGATGYGALDPNDVRRLSFISFADVVQSEHTHPAPASQLSEVGSRDNLHMASFPSMQERTASPLRSPRSPGSVYSQSTSGAGVVTPPLEHSIGAEQSPVRSGFSAPHNELTIQTMRQAVRKTASGDLSGVRSAGMSPVTSAADDGSLREARSRTNT